MSSSSAPSYYFSGINFNSSFFSSSSSSSSSIFSKKTMADTAQGLITFNAGYASDLACGKTTTNNISLYSTTTSQIQIGNASSTLLFPNTIKTAGTAAISLFDTQNRNTTMFAGITNYQLNIANNLSTGSMWIATSGTNQSGTINIGNDVFTTNATFTTGVINLHCPTVLYQPLVLNSASNPTSNLQLGWNYSFNNTSRITGISQTAVGTYPIYTSATSIPIGIYLITLNGGIAALSISGGLCGYYEAGFTYGVSSTASSNPVTTIYKTNGTQYVGGSLPKDMVCSYNYTVSVTTTGNYLAGYLLFNISSSLNSGNLTPYICSYSLTRIG